MRFVAILKIPLGPLVSKGLKAQPWWSVFVPGAISPSADQHFLELQDDMRRAALKVGIEPVPMLCYGACGAKHAQASVAAVIDVYHDKIGLPQRSTVLMSSGDKRFDNAVLAAIKEAKTWVALRLPEGPRQPEWSRWVFSAVAYQWSRSEMILDPGFIPPGRRSEEMSSAAAVTTIDQSVRLIDWRAWPEEYR